MNLLDIICIIIVICIIIFPIFFNGFLIFYLVRAIKNKKKVSNIILGLIATYILSKIYLRYLFEAIALENIVYLCCLFLPLIIISYFPIKYKIKNVILLKKAKKKYQFYREIPNEYEPILNSYLYFRKIEIKNALLSEIVELTNKGYINIENNTFSINETSDNLSIIQKYILVAIKIKDKVKEKQLIKYLNKKLEKNNLVKPRHSLTMDIVLTVIALTIIFIIFAKTNFSYIFVGILFPIVMLFIYYTYNQFEFNYVYTEDGLDEYAKIHSLKMFLKEFSIIDERNIKEYKLWEKYLSYAIALKVNIKNNKYLKENYPYVYQEDYLTSIDYSYGIFETIGSIIKSILKK